MKDQTHGVEKKKANKGSQGTTETGQHRKHYLPPLAGGMKGGGGTWGVGFWPAEGRTGGSRNCRGDPGTPRGTESVAQRG